MNHISRTFLAPGGGAYRSHAWELREGGYRRLALVLGYPFWPVERDKRLVGFLMERGFRVAALELGLGRAEGPRSGMAGAGAAAAAFAAAARTETGLPLYVFAASFSAAAVIPFLPGLEGLAAAAFLSPVLDFPPAGLEAPRCFLSPWARLPAGPAELSGKPELLEGILDGFPGALRFRRRDIKALEGAKLADAAGRLGVPAAAFVGEEDPWVGAAARDALGSAGIKVYSYPRARHAPAWDRYADNLYADLGSFVGEVEASLGRRKTSGPFS